MGIFTMHPTHKTYLQMRTLLGMEQRSIHLAFGLALVFLLNPLFENQTMKCFVYSVST